MFAGSSRRSLALVLASVSFPVLLSAQVTAPPVSFGPVNVGSSATQNVTFTFSASSSFTALSVVTQGSTGADFQQSTTSPGTCLPANYPGSTSCTVGVNFTPLAPGLRSGSVTLMSGSSLVATGYVSGIGVSALAVFSGATLKELAGAVGSAEGVAVDNAGDVYYTSNLASGRVYKLTPGAGITTYPSFYGPVAVSVDGAGNVFYISSGEAGSWPVDEVVGGQGATPVSFSYNSTNQIQGSQMATDGAGNLYLPGPAGVTELSVSGGSYTQSTVAGTSSLNVRGLTLDSAGNIYTLDNTTVTMITPGGRVTQIVAGGGLNDPNGIAVDPAGNVYVANTGGQSVLRFAAGTYAETTVDSGYAAQGLGVDSSGNLYVADSSNSRILEYLRGTPVVSSTSMVAVGSTSSETVYTVENDGNTTGTIAAITAVSPAIQSSGTCAQGTVLAVNATCTIGVEFAPTSHATSSQSGSVTLSGNFPPAVIQVSGTVSGIPSQLGFTTPPAAAGSAPAAGNSMGAPIQVTVETSTGTPAQFDTTAPITLTVTDPAANYSQTYGPVNAVNGVASFDTSGQPLTVTGTYTYTATTSISGLTGATASETVGSGPVTRVTSTPASTIAYSGAADNVTVSAYDKYNNVASNSTDTFALTSTNTNATLPANFVLSGGSATRPVTFNQSGSFTVTATDTATLGAGTSTAIAVQPLPTFTVTVLADPATPQAANCSNQAISGATLDASCSLRDALAAVDAAGCTGTAGQQPTVDFAPALYRGGAATITLTQGTAITVAHNVNLAGPGPSLLALSGNGASGILVQGGASTRSTVSGLTLTQAKGAPAFYSSSTGGVENFSNDVFLSNINASTKTYGGAIATLLSPSAATTVNVAGSSFISNQGVLGGAILQDYGALTIADSNFSNNSATTASAAEGGAVYCYGAALAIANGSFTGNTATGPNAYGGAIYANGSPVANSIANSTFSGNSTSGSTISDGGALYLASQTVSLTGVTISGNSALGAATARYGGGIYRSAGTLSFYNTTITGNSARQEGGLYSTTPSMTLDNSLIGGNSTATSYSDMNYAPTSTTGSLSSTNSPSTSPIIPLLSALGNYGGPVVGAGAYTTVAQTQVPLPGSPLLAYGTNTAAAENLATLDARGLARTTAYNGTTHVDTGAVQANYTLAFAQEPASARVNTAFSPVPSVQIYESGLPFNAAGGKLTVAAGSGTPSSASVAILGSSVPLAVTFPEPERNDTLTASIMSGATIVVTVASDTSAAFNITDAAATLGFGAPPPAQLTTGSSPGTVTVQMLTSTGAVDSAGADTIQLAVTGPATASYTAAAVNGVATFAPAALANAGTYTYTASDTGASPYTTDTVATTELVAADLLDHFSVAGIPAAVDGGESYRFTVTARDASNAVLSSYAGPVFLTSSDGLASFVPQNDTFNLSDAGVHTFTVTFGTAGVQAVTASNNIGQIGSETGIHVSVAYIWVVNATGTVSELSAAGSPLVSGGGTSSAASALGGVANDASGNTWSVTSSSNTLDFVTINGTGATSYAGGGLSTPTAVAVDGNGSIWIANAGNNSVSEFSNAGAALTPASTGYPQPATAPAALAIDTSGSVWVAGTNGTVTEVLGVAAPVTPLAQGATNSTTGTRP